MALDDICILAWPEGDGTRTGDIDLPPHVELRSDLDVAFFGFVAVAGGIFQNDVIPFACNRHLEDRLFELTGAICPLLVGVTHRAVLAGLVDDRSEEHTSELQSRGLISYAVFCLKKKTH